MEETVMTQMESLCHTENSHHYHHPFSGQNSAHSLLSMSAVPSFSNCLMHASLMLVQKHNSWQDGKSLKAVELRRGKILLLKEPALGIQRF